MLPHALPRRLALAAPALLRPMLWAGRASAQDRALRVIAPWTYDTSDPVDTGYILVRLGIGETLVTVEPDGRLVGRVAESSAVDPDRLTWRFRLREAWFHDGTSVTAAAVAACLKRVQPKAEMLSTIPFAAIKPDGKRELLLHTHTPFAPLPFFLVDYTGVVLAPSAYDAAGKVAPPIATGLYRVTAIQGAQMLEAEVFPKHWGVRPAIPRIRGTATVLGETRANMAEADLAFTLLPQAAERFEAGGGEPAFVTVPSEHSGLVDAQQQPGPAQRRQVHDGRGAVQHAWRRVGERRALEHADLHGQHPMGSPRGIEPLGACTRIGAEQPEPHGVHMVAAAGIVGNMLQAEANDLAGQGREEPGQAGDVLGKRAGHHRHPPQEVPHGILGAALAHPSEGR